MSRDLTIVIKGDGSGLTGAVKGGAGEIRQFGVDLDKVGEKSKQAGDAGEKAAKQIGDAFGKAARGNVRGAAEDIAKVGGRAALGLGALGVAATAVAAGLGLVTVAMVQNYREGREMTRSILLSGNAAGTTVGRMRDLRNEIGAVHGEYGRAREAVNALVRAGDLSGSALASAARSAVNIAMLSGDSIESITRKMSANADEPAKLMRKLNDEYGFLTAEVYSQVVALEKEGRTREALKVGYNELEKVSSERVTAMVEQAGWLEKGWRAIKNEVLGAWQAMKDWGRADIEKRVQDAARQMENMRLGAGLSDPETYGPYLKAREAFSKVLGEMMEHDAKVDEQIGRRNLQQRGIEAISAIDKAMDAARTKTEQYQSAVQELAKSFETLRRANPNDARLSGVQFGADGTVIGGGAYDTAVAGLKEKYRDRGAERLSAQQQREEERNAERRARTMERLNELTRDQESLYAGPVQEAMNDHASVLARINTLEQDLIKSKGLDAAAEEQLATARQNATAAHERNLELAKREQAEMDRRADIVGSLLADYEREIVAVTMTREQREIHAAVLHAEAQARENYRKGLRDTIDLTHEEVDAIAQGIGAMSRWADSIQDWAAVSMNAVGASADLVSDAFSGGIKKSRDFFSELKDIFRNGWRDIVRTVTQREFVEPFQRAILGMLSGKGFSGAGMSFGNMAAALASGMATGNGGSATAIGTGTVAGVLGMLGGTSTAHAATPAAAGAASSGVQLVQVGGQVYQLATGSGDTSVGGLLQLGASAYGQLSGGGGFLSGQFGNGLGYAGAALGAYGLYYGATQRGNGGLSSGLAGASYGALGVAAGGALAGMAGGAGAVAGATGAMGGAASALGAAAWVPVVGWILAAAAVIDMVSGGRLFGTKYQLDSSASTLNFGANGITGMQEITKVRQRSLFRGRQWSTSEQAFDAESQAALDDVFEQMNSAIATAARKIGVDAPDMISASFRQEFDKKGNLKKEFGTIAGRVYEEAQDVFLQRLAAENLLNVAKQVGNAAEIDRLADRYRDTPESLDMFAQFMAALQEDVNKSNALWASTGPGVLTSIVETMRSLGQGAETLLQTYQRINASLMEYGNYIGAVRAELMTAGLSEHQRAALDIERAYREQVRTANELAQALGLSGARSEDLASIEQLRAVRMADLQQAMEAERDRTLEDLRLGQYSPLTDREKLTDAMGQLSAAVGAGDVQRARQLSDTALGLGRNLYASGSDYNAVYSQVTALLDSMGLDNMNLDMDDGTTMGELADILTDIPGEIARELFALLYAPTASTPTVTTPPADVGTGTGSTGGGGGGLGSGGDMAEIRNLLQKLVASSERQQQAQELSSLRLEMR